MVLMENENCFKNKGVNRVVEVIEFLLRFRNKMFVLGVYFKYNFIKIMYEGK